ncbi:MAG: poly(A) polymerase [Candidatus Poriferisodalaceae bacterium]
MKVSDHPEFESLMARVEPLAERFRAAGHLFHLVGGLVRDLSVGRALANDIDATTDATPIEITSLLDGLASVIWDQGARFGTIGARIDGIVYEITTHRTETYDPGSRQPMVSFEAALDLDLSRRDFTINAMALSVPDAVIVDPHGGLGDLRSRQLRTPLDPFVSFSDDPVRMLRAARFLAGFDLEPVDGLEAAMVDLANRLEIVSAERIRDELVKLLAVPRPGQGVDLLARTGVLSRVIPRADELGDFTFRVLDRLDSALEVRLAALVDPLVDGAVVPVLQTLRFSSRDCRSVAGVVDALREVRAQLSASDQTVAARRLLHGHGDSTELALGVLAAELIEAGKDLAPHDAIAEAVARVRATEGIDTLNARLSGHDVLAVVGADAGPMVGVALEMLTEHRLVQGPTSAAEAREVLAKWWASTGA